MRRTAALARAAETALAAAHQGFTRSAGIAILILALNRARNVIEKGE
jgi:hypothetical protein